MIEFDGKEYPIRLLDIPNFGKRLVSVESLEESLFDAEGLYVSDEAQVVDEKIFFFVPDNIINEDEKEIVRLIEEIVNENHGT